MKAWALGMLACSLGVVLGMASTWYEFANTKEQMRVLAPVDRSPQAPTRQPRQPTGGTPVAVVVDGEERDFGLLQPNDQRQVSFLFRNDGEGPLEIKNYGVTCGLCVKTDFEKAVIPPGESASIPVHFVARKPGPQLNESLEVTTNDPQREHVRLELIAYVTRPFRPSLDTLALGTIATDEESTSTFQVYGYYAEDFDVGQMQLSNSDKDKMAFFDLQSRKLERSEFESMEPRALSAYEIQVRVKPGLPVGPMRQTIQIPVQDKGNGESPTTLYVPVEARVSGDVSLLGPPSSFNAEKNTLLVGKVNRGEGFSAKLNIMVKGEHRESTEVSITSIEPAEALQATLEEVQILGDGRVRLYPLAVTIPADAPSINRMGTAQAEFGKITIETTHPTAKKLTLYVRFAVE